MCWPKEASSSLFSPVLIFFALPVFPPSVPHLLVSVLTPMSPTAICALYEFVCFSMSLVQTPVYVQYRLLLENVVETRVCVSSSRYV